MNRTPSISPFDTSHCTICGNRLNVNQKVRGGTCNSPACCHTQLRRQLQAKHEQEQALRERAVSRRDDAWLPACWLEKSLVRNVRALSGRGRSIHGARSWWGFQPPLFTFFLARRIPRVMLARMLSPKRALQRVFFGGVVAGSAVG